MARGLLRAVPPTRGRRLGHRRRRVIIPCPPERLVTYRGRGLLGVAPRVFIRGLRVILRPPSLISIYSERLGGYRLRFTVYPLRVVRGR